MNNGQAITERTELPGVFLGDDPRNMLQYVVSFNLTWAASRKSKKQVRLVVSSYTPQLAIRAAMMNSVVIQLRSQMPFEPVLIQQVGVNQGPRAIFGTCRKCATWIIEGSRRGRHNPDLCEECQPDCLPPGEPDEFWMGNGLE